MTETVVAVTTVTVAAVTTVSRTVAAGRGIEAVTVSMAGTRIGTVAETVMGIGIGTETREGTEIWTSSGAGGMKMRKWRTGVLEEGGGMLLLRISAVSQSCIRFTEGG
jgi:hypothetical protein